MLNDKVDLLIEYLKSNDLETQMLGVSLVKTDPNIKPFRLNNYLVYNIYEKYLYFEVLK